MVESTTTKPDPLSRIPEALRRRVEQDCPLDSVQAWASCDLSDQSRYAQGYLVLTEGKLGHFSLAAEGWQGGWIAIPAKAEAAMAEGIGMGTLRLVRDSELLGEWRFSRRHEKEVAQLHRRLERQIKGEAYEEAPDKPTSASESDRRTRCEKCDRPIPAWSEVCPACMSQRKVLSRLLDWVRPYRAATIAAFVLSLLVTAAEISRPFLIKPMANKGLGIAHGATPDYRTLLFYVGLMCGLIAFAAVGGAFRQWLLAKLGSRVARDIRDQSYTHLHKLSLSFYVKKPTGSLVTRITSDSDRIWDFIAWTLIEVVMSFITVIGVASVMFWMNWQLALCTLIPVPAMLFLTIVFHKRMHMHHHRIFHRWSQMTSVVSDALPGVRVIKAFSQEKREVSRFGEKNQAVFQSELDMISLWTVFGPVLQLASQVGVLIVWVVGGWWVVKGTNGMDAGTLWAFTGAMWMFYGPIHMISHMDRMFNRAATSVQRIFDILDTPPMVFSKSGAIVPKQLRGQIELRNATFSYDGVRRVLKNVNLSINPGEMIGLAGPSGGGKTTLINLICRFYDVLEGQILIDGVDVRDYDVHELRRQVGVVLQEPFLFFGTVAENVAYGNALATREQIIRAAKAANAHDFIVGFPDGYDTMVGERGQMLSGGERQRISIARAILHDPRILILDEATSSVDTESEKLIQEAIASIVKNRTTIAIAHRLSTLQRADRLVILDKGCVVEQGSHAELSALPGGIYAKLLGMQNESKSFIAVGV